MRVVKPDFYPFPNLAVQPQATTNRVCCGQTMTS